MDAPYQGQTPAISALPTASIPLTNEITKFQGAILILLITVGLAMLGWYIFEVSANFDERLAGGIARIDAINEKMNTPVQWEYRIESFPDSAFDSKINSMGKDGWELVFARRASDGSDYSPTFSYEMIFKRPKKIESIPAEKSGEKKQLSKKK